MNVLRRVETGAFIAGALIALAAIATLGDLKSAVFILAKCGSLMITLVYLPMRWLLKRKGESFDIHGIAEGKLHKLDELSLTQIGLPLLFCVIAAFVAAGLLSAAVIAAWILFIQGG